MDEIQRIPALLNEIHLITSENDNYRFALTGSSARKLKRENANLLAGRAITRQFFPLTSQELGFDFQIDDILRFGTLPRVVFSRSQASRIDRLDAYIQTYLKEEIQQETRLRNLDSYSRFLEIAAMCNGQVVNVSNIARDSGVPRQTVQGYFEVLLDTLLGSFLRAWTPRVKIKEVQHPKFFFFDPGVVRALRGNLRDPLDSIERGHLLETWIFNELRAYQGIAGIGGEFFYWGTPSDSEVDFIWRRQKHSASFDVKDVQGMCPYQASAARPAQSAPVAAHAGAGGAVPVQAAQGPAIIPVMAGDPRVPPAFRDLGPENMYQVGNLIWSAMSRPQQVNQGRLAGRILPGRQVGGKMNQRDAERFCRNLGGGSRLPTREEYEVLARAMTVNGHYDRNRIPDMSGNWFWSSSVHPNSPDNAYSFYGFYGNISFDDRTY